MSNSLTSSAGGSGGSTRYEGPIAAAVPTAAALAVLLLLRL
eukprot:CAMPEP_0171892674 /NCGR_PEP_ID=MMETSP0992-20121227/45449_1 /TAXON_ID=483369 /ORGANISM="non described non described, Strain CCMP2098" /LENGTH=40 /DNA_ID= /DNA_START= /DNA_END= /DNA_ORIENTATION=